MTNIDPETGLPELPEGYFWRIKKDSAGTRVHLMKKLIFGVRMPVSSRYILIGYHSTPGEAIRSAAQITLEDKWGDVILSEYVGDYPPKRLEQ